MSNVNYDQEVKAGELQKWSEADLQKELEGVKIGYKETPDRGKGKGHVYELRAANGVIPFFAPSLLHEKMKQVPMGALVYIKFIKISKTPTGNTLKHFLVRWTTATPDKLKALGIQMYEVDVEGRAEIEGSEQGMPIDQIPT